MLICCQNGNWCISMCVCNSFLFESNHHRLSIQKEREWINYLQIMLMVKYIATINRLIIFTLFTANWYTWLTHEYNSCWRMDRIASNSRINYYYFFLSHLGIFFINTRFSFVNLTSVIRWWIWSELLVSILLTPVNRLHSHRYRLNWLLISD